MPREILTSRARRVLHFLSAAVVADEELDASVVARRRNLRVFGVPSNVGDDVRMTAESLDPRTAAL